VKERTQKFVVESIDAVINGVGWMIGFTILAGMFLYGTASFWEIIIDMFNDHLAMSSLYIGLTIGGFVLFYNIAKAAIVWWNDYASEKNRVHLLTNTQEKVK